MPPRRPYWRRRWCRRCELDGWHLHSSTCYAAVHVRIVSDVLQPCATHKTPISLVLSRSPCVQSMCTLHVHACLLWGNPTKVFILLKHATKSPTRTPTKTHKHTPAVVVDVFYLDEFNWITLNGCVLTCFSDPCT